MAAPDLGADLVAIGAAARATGTTVTTVRHYDDLGLLPTVTRESGRRRFDAASIERIRLVRGARRLGFTLDEIVALVGDVQIRIRGAADLATLEALLSSAELLDAEEWTSYIATPEVAATT